MPEDTSDLTPIQKLAAKKSAPPEDMEKNKTEDMEKNKTEEENKKTSEMNAGKLAAMEAAEREKNSAHLQDIVKANADKEAATKAAEEAAYQKVQMKVPGVAPQSQMAAPTVEVPMTEATKREMTAGKTANDSWNARRKAEIELGKQLTGKFNSSRK